jgi:hypothetical protein
VPCSLALNLGSTVSPLLFAFTPDFGLAMKHFASFLPAFTRLGAFLSVH